MNKQEVIDKLKEYGAWCTECHDINEKKDRYVKAAKVRELIEQLDEPQKVKVPAIVAKWFETNKYVLDRAILDYMFEDYASDNSEFGKWFDNKNGKPIETLVRMLDGYEVEEEPKYYLDLPKMGMVNEISNSQLCWTNCEGGITEKEIKAIDERYWPFAVPVEKV